MAAKIDSFYHSLKPEPFLKKLSVANGAEELFVRVGDAVNGALIDWGKRTSWQQGGFLEPKVANQLRRDEKKAKKDEEKKKKKPKPKTAEQFFIEKHLAKFLLEKNYGLSEAELIVCAKRKWALISQDDKNEDVIMCREHEANQRVREERKQAKKAKAKASRPKYEESDDTSSEEEDEEDDLEDFEEEEKVPTPEQAPPKTEAKRRRLSKAVQSPPAKRPAKASKADRPQPEHTPAAAAPGSAGRKPARSAGRAASVRSVRTEATLFPALTAAAAVASALDDLQTPKDLIMKDGTAMADPFAFPASSEGFTASPAPPRLGGKKKKRTPPSTGGADAGTSEPRTSPRLPRKPKRLTLDKVGDAA